MRMKIGEFMIQDIYPHQLNNHYDPGVQAKKEIDAALHCKWQDLSGGDLF